MLQLAANDEQTPMSGKVMADLMDVVEVFIEDGLSCLLYTQNYHFYNALGSSLISQASRVIHLY